MNISNLLRENIKIITPYSSARDEFNGDKNEMIFLDANENPFGKEINRYPDPNQIKLKEELSKLKKIESSKILIGNGSDEILDLLIRAFCEPKTDAIVTLPPTYGMYGVLAHLNDVENISVLLTAGFEPNVAEIEKITSQKTKLLFICSPNNPTGNAFSNTTIEIVLKKFPGIVVIDEAYIDFSSNKSWLSRLENYPNLVITQTLSKAYGMAGIRLGICYASEAIINVLKKIKPPYNVNSLTQNYALTKLKKKNKVQKQVSKIKKQRAILQEALKSVNYVEKWYPTDANFILLKVDNATKRYNQLIEKGLVVRNRTNQPLCENTLRISIGTKKENKKLIKTLKELE